jgi:hypothetical protein
MHLTENAVLYLKTRLKTWKACTRWITPLRIWQLYVREIKTESWKRKHLGCQDVSRNVFINLTRPPPRALPKAGLSRTAEAAVFDTCSLYRTLALKPEKLSVAFKWATSFQNTFETSLLCLLTCSTRLQQQGRRNGSGVYKNTTSLTNFNLLFLAKTT